MEKVAAIESRARLTNFLIIKSLAEALFVGALAIIFYLTAFMPYFRGALDLANARHVAGWAFNQAEPQSPVEVQLYIDGRFAGSRFASLPRPDVVAAGRAPDANHGFSFDTPALDVGEHEARVYAVHSSGGDTRRTLQLLGKPLRFSVTTEDEANRIPPVEAQPQ